MNAAFKRMAFWGAAALMAAGFGVFALGRGAEGMAAREAEAEGRTLKRGVMSPDGRVVALLRDDGAVEVTTPDGRRLGLVRGHGKPILAAHFLPDGRSVLTVDAAGVAISTRISGLDMREMAHGEAAALAGGQAWRRTASAPAKAIWTAGWRFMPGSTASRIMDKEARAPVLPKGMAAPAGTMFRDCEDCPEMVVVPAGEFLMGSPEDEEGRSEDEGPQRTVMIPAPFATGRFEVTVKDYFRCVDAGACRAPEWREANSEYNVETGTDDQYKTLGDALTAPDHPIVGIDWNDATAYAAWLRGETGRAYRLLTEAEWEYATRARTTSAYWWGATASHEYANYGQDECCEGLASGVDRWVNTAPVGQFDPNGFGLHDMHGNVWEWVEDCYADTYSAAQPSDGRTYTDCSASSDRVVRGGSWDDTPRYLRSARRLGNTPTGRDDSLGFRVARTP